MPRLSVKPLDQYIMIPSLNLGSARHVSRPPRPALRHIGPPPAAGGCRRNDSAASSGPARAASGQHGKAGRRPLRVRRQTGAAAPERSGQPQGDQAAGPAWAGGGSAAWGSVTAPRIRSSPHQTPTPGPCGWPPAGARARRRISWEGASAIPLSMPRNRGTRNDS
jgi:hypothetical protein